MIEEVTPPGDWFATQPDIQCLLFEASDTAETEVLYSAHFGRDDKRKDTYRGKIKQDKFR